MTDLKKTLYTYVQEEGTTASMQWKGTDICMDFECKCGHGVHIDGERVYYVKCPGCGVSYALSPQIRVIEVPPEFVEEVAESEVCWVDEYAGEPDDGPDPEQGWSMKNGVWTP